MFRKKQTEVLVVGGGPVGLFSALLLAEQGIQVELVEAGWRTAARSYALALHPHSLELMDRVGLTDRLLDKGHPLYALAFYEKSQRKAQMRFSELPGAQRRVLVLPQNVLEAELVQKLEDKGVKIRWNHRLGQLETDGRKALATIEKLGKESMGYSVSGTEWVVEKTFPIEAAFVVGADGHRSLVRRQLGIEFPRFAEPQTFAVFEFSVDRESGNELRIVFDGPQTNVCWPMDDHRCRWSFQLEHEEFAPPRHKSRLAVQVGETPFPYLSEDKLSDLLRVRAPWFQGQIKEISWSMIVKFEQRLAPKSAMKNVWLVGDSAHLAGPVGVQSMNVGLKEASEVVARISGLLHGKDPFSDLAGADAAMVDKASEEYGRNRRKEWEFLLGVRDGVESNGEATDWVLDHRQRIPACVPASGADLQLLLHQIGLETDFV